MKPVGRPLNSQSPTPPEIEERIQELRRRAEAGEPLWPMPGLEEANGRVNAAGPEEEDE